MAKTTKTNPKQFKMCDGNEATASVAYRMNEIAVIYPITPSSTMGELADDWAAKGQKNIFGEVPFIYEMQSEAGAIGAVHGALQAGAFATTFTASQGLLLMIPNMFKIAGELSSFVMHVAARSVATHALSIFGDHSDVMACRQTGFAMLCSNSVEEAQDMAAIAQMSTIKAKVPFLHFFDGFRTSHEINKINYLTDEELQALVKGLPLDTNLKRALTPDNPVIRGTAQNPDVFFQIREAGNKFYTATPAIVKEMMKKFAAVTGRKYDLVEYEGPKDAEHVIVLMGSGAETATTTAAYLNKNAKGSKSKVGVVKIRLFRPFPTAEFIKVLPKTLKTISVLEKTKEQGAIGEPLFLDVLAAFNETGAKQPKIFAGRYGLSSKDFTPAMVKAVFDNAMAKAPKKHFTVGIDDDVTNLSLAFDPSFDIEQDNVSRSVFFGLGSDGTVGANKNSIKIIADDGGFYGQAYFVYDSKKSGAMTTSHLRFSKSHPIKAPYLIGKAGFVACHHFPFLEKVDMLALASDGATFLINAPFAKDKVWDNLPKEVQEEIIKKHINLYAIDAIEVAEKTGMGRRINTIMQVCYFAISGVLPKDEAIAEIKKSIEKTYGKKGKEVVASNILAVDEALKHLHQIPVPAKVTQKRATPATVSKSAPSLVKNVTARIIEGKGDALPVSAFAFAADGTWPTGTAAYEKRRLAVNIPVWDPATCIQCGKCAMVCPHAAIRLKAFDNKELKGAPKSFRSAPYKGAEFKDSSFVVQVAPEDCTGCTLCTTVCPAKNKENPALKAINMEPLSKHLESEIKNFDFFLSLPEVDRTKLNLNLPKFCQMLQPLFEFSGACAGCGETPYIKLMTQLFGDRAIIANATGCTSIYSGNLPTTPYTKNKEGRGPAWSNSLFEDPAEFGLGMHFAVMFKKAQAENLLQQMEKDIGKPLVKALLTAPQTTDTEIETQRANVAKLKAKLKTLKSREAKDLAELADYLVTKSVWIFGGDGWAYDIGYGGLDHILHSGMNVNVLVLDTNVYSNTGGQQSKATPLGASAKFAAKGKSLPKKDLGFIAMSSGRAYVASVALGAKDTQTIAAFREAESFDGPSIIIANCHCIAHGYDLAEGLAHQKLAVETGLWPLYRFDPRRIAEGLPPLQLDYAAPSKPVSEFMATENRFKIVQKLNPERYNELVAEAQKEVEARRALYEKMAAATPANNSKGEEVKAN